VQYKIAILLTYLFRDHDCEAHRPWSWPWPRRPLVLPWPWSLAWRTTGLGLRLENAGLEPILREHCSTRHDSCQALFKLTFRNLHPSLLGMTLTRKLSALDHIQRVVSNCLQTLYALRVLHHCCPTDAGISSQWSQSCCMPAQCGVVFLWDCLNTVLICSLTVRHLLWSDWHCIDTFLSHSTCSGYCQPDFLSFNVLVEDFTDKLFSKLWNNSQHSLHYLLSPPSPASQHYNLHPVSSCNRQLPSRTRHFQNWCQLHHKTIISQGWWDSSQVI